MILNCTQSKTEKKIQAQDNSFKYSVIFFCSFIAIYILLSNRKEKINNNEQEEENVTKEAEQKTPIDAEIKIQNEPNDISKRWIYLEELRKKFNMETKKIYEKQSLKIQDLERKFRKRWF